MPRLTDVFASILSDLAAARKMADEQTIRIAEEYHANPLLAALTVPRIRIADVMVELPVLIESCELAPPSSERSGSDGARALPGGLAEKATPESFARIAGAVLDQVLVESGRDALPRGVPMLDVVVGADEIKSRGEGVPITKLRITLREEGMELVSPGDAGGAGGASRDLDGKSGFRLIPE